MSTQDPEAGTSSTSGASSREDRLKRLKELHLRRNEARKLNHQEVVEEDRRKKLPTNWEAKRKRVEWEEEEEKKRQECEAKGEDYDRVKLLDVGADEAERWERKKKKKNPDPGFSDYEAATHRQYQRLTKQLKPDMNDYERKKEKMGEEFYADTSTLITSQPTDSKEAIDRMVEDVEKQIEKRSKYSRRRAHDEDADIDYINDRNAKFNKKLERFYGQYTTEIKQNLERGTAV
ncbi:pre-mRNA-splicing factor SYF2 [Lingula anatina]|uniref:Pre-mRNA-splicing factor SYF2 n=1 Tax=Lingula anatina TaxID=7574 RepID=A0A1S3J5C2_LINAN|nr:pre-mRNA-splicing factor SYF2 [Lingula anatina]|eukprot:XP_013405461.1 pre-mRNA-splicing factor SYF2 [Lingula anatina]